MKKAKNVNPVEKIKELKAKYEQIYKDKKQKYKPKNIEEDSESSDNEI